MKTIQKLLLAVLLSLFACAALAQGGGGGRQGRGFRGGGAFGLLRMPEVQAELRLTDDQKSKLDALRTQMFSNNGGAQDGTRPTAEEMQQRAAEQRKQIEALLTSDQIHRLHELEIQRAGDRAVLMSDVQEALGLTDDQKNQIKDLNEKYQSASTSIREKQRNNEIDRATAREDMQKNSETLLTEIHKVLTPAQVDKLKSLGGAPFTFPQRQRGGGGGGGGGR